MNESKPELRLDGAVAIVTGGTKGIGRGIAETLLAAGAEVIVCGRSASESLLESAGRCATFIACDVRDPADVAKLVDTVADRHGRIDVLINNAGGGPASDAATSSPRLIEKIVQLNLLGPFYCAQAVNRVMQTQDTGGSIINIASVSATRPSPGTAAYGAAKAGLLNLTESLAMDWGPKVRVNAVIAGLVDTENARDHYGGPEGIARIGEALPLKRMARPADIAAACLYLASPFSIYVSGARLAVHGGGEPPLFLKLGG